MKRLPCLFIILFFLCSCGHSGTGDNAAQNDTRWTPPPAGTVVAADSMKIDDPLNTFYFAVKLISSPANGEEGTFGFIYDIETHYGPANTSGRFSMPSGGKDLKPLLRKATDGSYTFIIGFIPGKEFGGDNTFKEYYAVSGNKGSIEIRALKGYKFQ